MAGERDSVSASADNCSRGCFGRGAIGSVGGAATVRVRFAKSVRCTPNLRIALPLRAFSGWRWVTACLRARLGRCSRVLISNRYAFAAARAERLGADVMSFDSRCPHAISSRHLPAANRRRI
jgi:hypothetical protein